MHKRAASLAELAAGVKPRDRGGPPLLDLSPALFAALEAREGDRSEPKPSCVEATRDAMSPYMEAKGHLT